MTDQERIAGALGLGLGEGEYYMVTRAALRYAGVPCAAKSINEWLPARIEAALRAAVRVSECDWCAGAHLTDADAERFMGECLAAGIAELEGSGDGD